MSTGAAAASVEDAAPPPGEEGGAPRFTTHKPRADWFQQRASYPYRERYVRALGARTRHSSTHHWEEAGPFNIGGRLTALAVHPHHPDHVYAGSAGGGVWFSENAGKTWHRKWNDQELTLSIGSLAIDPRHPSVLYCGTGEANMTSDNYPGAGVYRSANGCDTWTRVGSPEQDGLPRRIGAIAVDPFDSKHIRLGGVTHSDSEPAALFFTRNGGADWIRQPGFISERDYHCHAVVFHPVIKDLIFATVDARGSQSGLWRSKNGGQNWERVFHAVLPPGDEFGRTTLAISSDGKVIYALAGKQRSGDLLGLFRSDDLGESWRLLGEDYFPASPDFKQLYYNNCLAVDPGNPDVLIVGGLNLHRSMDGGVTWKKLTFGSQPLNTGDAHVEHHALVITSDGKIYSANDGGFAFSTMRNEAFWEMRVNRLAATMFYDMDVSPADSRCFGGGGQDIGTVLTHTPDVTGPAAYSGRGHGFEQVRYGDGGWLLYGPDAAEHMYASSQRMNLYIHDASSREWRTALPVSAGKRWIPEEEAKSIWMAIVAMDPSTRKPGGQSDQRTLYVGSTRIWKSDDDGLAWFPVSPHLDGSPITAIEVAPAFPRCLYAGTQRGGIFRSTDAGRTWSGNLAGPDIPGRNITRIDSKSDDANCVMVTVGGVGTDRTPPEEDSQPFLVARYRHPGSGGMTSRLAPGDFGHVFLSWDAGDSWVDADRGHLPNLPHNAIVILGTGESPHVYVAHDGGVHTARLEESLHWKSVCGSLPNVPVVDLVYHEKDHLLFAATYGRGIWRLKL